MFSNNEQSNIMNKNKVIMETKFTKAIEDYNSLINTLDCGSKEYKLSCLAKYLYIKHV